MALTVEIGTMTVQVQGNQVAFAATLQTKDDSDGTVIAETQYQTPWYLADDPATPQNRDDAFAYAANEWFQGVAADQKVRANFSDARDSVAEKLALIKEPVAVAVELEAVK